MFFFLDTLECFESAFIFINLALEIYLLRVVLHCVVVLDPSKTLKLSLIAFWCSCELLLL
jgi:hypothetical protein